MATESGQIGVTTDDRGWIMKTTSIITAAVAEPLE
jgi:hypothetical protein